MKVAYILLGCLLMFTQMTYAANSEHFTIINKSNVKVKSIDLEQLYDLSKLVLHIDTDATRVKVIILPTYEDVGKAYHDNGGEGNPEFMYSFYASGKKTIFISATNYVSTVLAHEITHALVTQYYFEPISMQSQEIWCGYVEYKLRKLK